MVASQWSEVVVHDNYDFIIRYVSEKTNTRADLLSRKDQIDVTKDNRNIKMLRQVKIWWMEASVVLFKEDKATQDTWLKDKSKQEKEIHRKLTDEKNTTKEQDGIV